MAINLLVNVSGNSANGTGVVVDVYQRMLSVWATDFGGGTVTLQASPDAGTTWIDLSSYGVPLAFTSNTITNLNCYVGRGMLVRAALAGATSAIGVNASLYETIG